ncbi:MAG: putative 4-hydroxybenzoate polyprenyltransferase [Bacteroidales bacterium]|jgi:4-hydroxybenzoate polyprenyltransferase|nr:putative 4-hydroxybenzoate polyprenyltransferase [Bacteroidales bacterium]
MTGFLKRILKYSSLVKISHSIFSLPFAVIGYFLAVEQAKTDFEAFKIGLIILCVVFARNAAMSFNRITDRYYDAQNPRTQQRVIPSGKISIKNAYIFLVVNIILFIATTWFINMTCFLLAPVALIIILGYSYTKRFTYFSHFILGMGLSLAPAGAFLAVYPHFNIVILFLSLAVLFWVGGFDIIYALPDELFDKKNKLHSIPEHFGIKKALFISASAHLLTLFFLITAGILNQNGLFFWIGLVLFAVLIIYQHLIINPKDFSRINLAFFTLNGISGIIFSIFYILDLYCK